VTDDTLAACITDAAYISRDRSPFESLILTQKVCDVADETSPGRFHHARVFGGHVDYLATTVDKHYLV